jgi:hypothetical protein
MHKKYFLILIMLCGTCLSVGTTAAVDMGVGKSSTGCREVARSIVNEWFALRNFMSPGKGSMKRPKSTDFQCISPYYVRNLFQKNTLGQVGLSCFTSESGGGICCDKAMKSCATLRQ